MHWLKTTLVILLALLSIAAGVPKLIQLPQELGFLQAIGFNAAMVSLLGIVQIAAGVTLAVPRSRFLGAVAVTIGFLISTIALFVAGNSAIGAVSLLPVLLAGYIAINTKTGP
jgi:hypothetical protein